MVSLRAAVADTFKYDSAHLFRADWRRVFLTRRARILSGTWYDARTAHRPPRADVGGVGRGVRVGHAHRRPPRRARALAAVRPQPCSSSASRLCCGHGEGDSPEGPARDLRAGSCPPSPSFASSGRAARCAASRASTPCRRSQCPWVTRGRQFAHRAILRRAIRRAIRRPRSDALSAARAFPPQVFARELRGWGSAECGLFGSLSGFGGMAAALLTRRSVRRFGTRGHTVAATACVAATDLTLALSPGRQARAARPFCSALTTGRRSSAASFASGVARARAQLFGTDAGDGAGGARDRGGRRARHGAGRARGRPPEPPRADQGGGPNAVRLPVRFGRRAWRARACRSSSPACIATTANLVVTIPPRSWWTTPSYPTTPDSAAAAATPATAVGLVRRWRARPRFFDNFDSILTYYAPRHLTSPTPVNADLSARVRPARVHVRVLVLQRQRLRLLLLLRQKALSPARRRTRRARGCGAPPSSQLATTFVFSFLPVYLRRRRSLSELRAPNCARAANCAAAAAARTRTAISRAAAPC